MGCCEVGSGGVCVCVCVGGGGTEGLGIPTIPATFVTQRYNFMHPLELLSLDPPAQIHHH